jgi:hypothetical protein
MIKELKEMKPLRHVGLRKTEDYVPTMATEPEHLLTKAREKEIQNREAKISKYFSNHISEQINISVDIAIDSIIKLSKAFKLGRAISELIENEN